VPEYANTEKFSTYYYWLNCKHSILKDVRVRRALSLAIDRDVLINKYLKGLKQPAIYWQMPTGIKGFPYEKRVEFNPEKARKLLADAGYPDPSKMPPLQISYNTNDDHRLIAEVIQQMLATHLGIRATIQNMEWKVFLKQLQRHDFEVARMGQIGEYVYPMPMLEVFITGAEGNFASFSNATFDKLWQQAMLTSNPQKRMQLYGQMENILADEVPIIPLYYYKTTTLLQPWVRGLYRNILLIPPLKWVWLTPRDQPRRTWDTVLEWTRIPIPRAA
jgi:oligopeptide transport system substrate-binding protein